MCFPEQRLELAQAAEQRINRRVVGNVVAEIDHRRGKDRRQPDRINAKFGKIRQARDDAGEIADAITVPVLKRTRINLVEDARLPPVHTRRSRGRLVAAV
jgi:hypothetical protein